MNNTSGKYFVKFEVDNLYGNKTVPPKPYRIGDTSKNWKKTIDLTQVEVLHEYDHFLNKSTSRRSLDFTFSRRLQTLSLSDSQSLISVPSAEIDNFVNIVAKGKGCSRYSSQYLCLCSYNDEVLQNQYPTIRFQIG